MWTIGRVCDGVSTRDLPWLVKKKKGVSGEEREKKLIKFKNE